MDTNPKAMLQVACKDESVNDIIEAVRSVANTNYWGWKNFHHRTFRCNTH